MTEDLNGSLSIALNRALRRRLVRRARHRKKPEKQGFLRLQLRFANYGYWRGRNQFRCRSPAHRSRLSGNGAITRRTLVQTSGNAMMDDSVMKAVQSVSKLRSLPPQWTGSYKDIDITFDLSAGAF